MPRAPRAARIQFNLSDFTRRAYGTNYIETLRVQLHANCRIRRIYFSDRLYSEEELPPEFKLFLPAKASEIKCEQLRASGRGGPEGPSPGAGTGGSRAVRSRVHLNFLYVWAW